MGKGMAEYNSILIWVICKKKFNERRRERIVMSESTESCTRRMIIKLELRVKEIILEGESESMGFADECLATGAGL
jgi:hypothetical protein